MVGEPVEQSGGHLGVAEYGRPLAEGQVRRDDDGRPLVEPADEVEEELAHWWETFQNVSDVMREDMVDAQRKDGQGKSGGGKARRVKRSEADQPADGRNAGPATATPPDPRFRDDAGASQSNGPATQAGEASDDPAAPKKRRRRRRKPAGGAADTPDASGGE